MQSQHQQKPKLFDKVDRFLRDVSAAYDEIPAERKVTLRQIARYIESRIKAADLANLIFICTHNSRRSHMSQIWAQAAATFHQIPDVRCYSGGTEATAFHPNAVRAMRKAGFAITKRDDGSNPVYEVRYAENIEPHPIFSKKYDDAVNPHADFAAVMTCAHADQNCPVVFGAALRMAIPYDDPKEADGTPQEELTYDERCRQIAIEMSYLFSSVIWEP